MNILNEGKIEGLIIRPGGGRLVYETFASIKDALAWLCEDPITHNVKVTKQLPNKKLEFMYWIPC